MKVLTIWQPWASLIIAGAKPYEFRGWEAPKWIQGQRIGIHAGARPVRKAEIAELIARLNSDAAWSTGLLREIALPLLERWHLSPASLPLSSILGTAVLGRPVSAFDIVHEFGAQLNDSDRDEHGNFAWPVSEIETFTPIAPAKGMQGFWNWLPGPLP